MCTLYRLCVHNYLTFNLCPSINAIYSRIKLKIHFSSFPQTSYYIYSIYMCSKVSMENMIGKRLHYFNLVIMSHFLQRNKLFTAFVIIKYIPYFISAHNLVDFMVPYFKCMQETLWRPM